MKYKNTLTKNLLSAAVFSLLFGQTFFANAQQVSSAIGLKELSAVELKESSEVELKQSSSVIVETSSTMILTGQWQQGALLFGQVNSGESVRFLNHEVPVTDSGHFVIGLGRDAPSQVELIVVSDRGETSAETFAVAQRNYNIQKVEGVPARTVNPDPKHLKRIQNEAWLAKKARKQILDRDDYLETFQWPVIGRISGVYGSQRYYNGEARRPHFGVDVAAPTGTRIVAPVSGVVTLAYDDMFFSGGTLIIDHGHGLSSSFLHLSKILVKDGQEVKQGEAIAEVGATGRVTGPHLDWRMNWFDQRVDPQLLVPSMDELLSAQPKAD